MNITSVSVSIRKWLFIWTKYCTDPPEFQLVECSDEELPKKVAEAERNVENLTVVPADLAFNFLYDNLHEP